MTVTPPHTPQTPAPGRAPRWMWIALVASVALNLLVVGFAAATLLHFRKGPRDDHASRFARYVETLPEQRRTPLKAMLDEQRNRIRPLRRSLREARRRARDAFAAEPFDNERLAKAYADSAEARIALTKARQEWFPKLAGMLTVEERREYLNWIRDRRRGWRWRRHRD